MEEKKLTKGLSYHQLKDFDILIWDNDGTIKGSINPNDKSDNAKVILPNVEKTMRNAKHNFVICGFKSAESEMQDFDEKAIANKFIKLMESLPIKAAAFSPKIGGVACYVVVNHGNKISIIEAHKDQRYKNYVGKFKKPDIGMFQVIKDIALSAFFVEIAEGNTIMIGDTWHDQEAAKSFGINFMDAKEIHKAKI